VRSTSSNAAQVNQINEDHKFCLQGACAYPAALGRQIRLRIGSLFAALVTFLRIKIRLKTLIAGLARHSSCKNTYMLIRLLFISFFVSPFAFGADLVKLSRRSFLFGSGAAVITTAAPRNTDPHYEQNLKAVQDLVNYLAEIPPLTDEMKLKLLMGSPGVGKAELPIRARQIYGIHESPHIHIPKIINAGWNPVAFSGPQISPVPGLIRTLRRDLFETILTSIRQGEIQSSKEAILAIEQMEETPCSPKLEPPIEQVPTVLIIEDEI